MFACLLCTACPVLCDEGNAYRCVALCRGCAVMLFLQLAAVTEDIHVPPAELTTNTEDLLRQRQAQMQQ